MFGLDAFNYGQTFQAPISDYTDPDDEKYYCIDPDSEIFNERVVWINGDNNITDLDGKLVNEEIDRVANQQPAHFTIGLRKISIGMWKERLEEMGFIEDCVKAKQEQNVGGSGGGGGGNDDNGDSPKCSDTNQVVNDDGTCGDCQEGYIKDIDSDSDTYGECIAVDNTLLYAGIGGAALLLLIVALK